MGKISDALNAALWVTCSPVEWTWTHDQQIAMARYCVEAARTIEEARQLLETIVCVHEPDRGVVQLDHEGTCHYDPVQKCQVYDHEHFSALGDALIGLHEKLKSLQEPDHDR